MPLDSQARRRAAEVDWSEAFQRRRRSAWRKSRWAFLAALASWVVGFFWMPDDPRVFMGLFLLFAAAILRLIYIAKTVYTCPACGSTPTPPDKDGVALDPEFCSTCGVRLKPARRSSRPA